MRPVPRSKRSYPLAALTALVVGCGAPASFPTADHWEKAERRPDGVILDRPAAVASAAPRGASSAGAVVLAVPLGEKAAIDLLDRLLDAMLDENGRDLSALLADGAIFYNPISGPSSVVPAAKAFDDRFRRFDYRVLAGRPLVREGDVEVYGYDDLAALPPGRPRRPSEMEPSDTLVRAHILTPRVGPDRLFGDDLTLVLRPVDGRFAVRAVIEEISL